VTHSEHDGCWKRVVAVVAVISLVLTGLDFLFGGAVLPGILRSRQARRAPEFEFRYEGVLEPGVPAYEVTDELRWMDDPHLLGDFEIVVSADYRGHELREPVFVRILPESGDPVTVAEWANFQSHHNDPRRFRLNPGQLFEYSGVGARPGAFHPASGMPADAEGEFVIQVGTYSQELFTETVTVVNTPWVHFTQLSNSVISAGDPVTAHVMVSNLGGPSEFNVIGVLYEATSYEVSTLEKNWWPAKTWRLTGCTVWQESPGKVATDEQFSVELVIPGDQFEAGRLYILETYAVKRLPYLTFPVGDWRSSDESWRLRSEHHLSMIVTVAP